MLKEKIKDVVGTIFLALFPICLLCTCIFTGLAIGDTVSSEPAAWFAISSLISCFIADSLNEPDDF